MFWAVFVLSMALCLLGICAKSPVTTKQRRDGPNTNVKCKPEYNWMNNEAGQSPCLVWAHVMTSCGTADFNVLALSPNSHYDPPSGNGEYKPSACSCSWAGYSLMGACTVCQGIGDAGIDAWGPWKDECSKSDLSDTTYFPYDKDYTVDVKIPYWAGENPMNWTNSRFDPDAAKSIDDENHPDLDGSEFDSGSPRKSSMQVGPIIGGVVGGVALALAIALAWWFFRRPQKLNRRHTRTGSQEILIGDENEHRHSHHTGGALSMIQSQLSPLSDKHPYFGFLQGSTVLMSPTSDHHTNALHQSHTHPSSSLSGTPPPASYSRHTQPQNMISPFTSRSHTGTPPPGKAQLSGYNTPPRRVETEELALSDTDTSITLTPRRMNPPAYSPPSSDSGHRLMGSDLTCGGSGSMSLLNGSIHTSDFGDRMRGTMTRGVDRPFGLSEVGDVDPAYYA